MIKTAIPTRSLALLMAIGFTDLVATAWLHQRGLIQELNPVMALFLQHGELPFIIAKGLTLVGAWYVLARYAKTDLNFVRRACLGGSLAYAAIWTVWFVSAR
jgi:hypothetical protein